MIGSRSCVVRSSMSVHGAVSGIVTARASRKGPISPSALDQPMVRLLTCDIY